MCWITRGQQVVQSNVEMPLVAASEFAGVALGFKISLAAAVAGIGMMILGALASACNTIEMADVE